MKSLFPPLACIGLLLAFLPPRSRAEPAGIPHYQPEQVLAGDMRTVAESSADPLMLDWVAGFRKFHPGFTIIDKGNSPLACVPAVACGGNDLGFPARELWAFEVELFRSVRGYSPFVIQVGLGSQKTTGLTPTLGVYVNAGNPIERISLDQLDAVYSSERRRGGARDIRTWGDLGVTGEWATREIHAYSHRLPNGIDYFVQKVVTQGAGFKKTTTELPMRRGNLGPDDLMAQAIARDADGLGLGCFGNVIAGMKTIAVGVTDAGPYYSGTMEEIQSLRYPLCRPIYMVVDRPPGQPLDPRLREFLRFVLSAEGQEIVAATHTWIALPATVAAGELAKLN